MFRLSDAAKENLEAILDEFGRVGRFCPPLFHERLIPWSATGQIDLTDDSWQAFIVAESQKLDDSEWWEWDGPHSSEPSFSGSCLGRWCGYPDGMQEFVSLVDSVTTVLQREDFSDVDDIELPFAFRTFTQWVSTLHVWAFRFQMPLLRSDMTLWGAEDADPSDFLELSEVWHRADGIEYPLHPVCWTLIDNVFTSSATAIRSILRPEFVIATNEPWPRRSLDRDTARVRTTPVPSAVGVDSPRPVHRLVETPHGWTFIPAGSTRLVFSRHQTGLHRAAVLIDNASRDFQPEELAKFGGRSSRTGRKASREEVGDETGITVSSNAKMTSQSKDDAESREAVGEELRHWLNAREEAERSENLEEYEEAEKHINKIKEQYHVTADGTVKPQRPFRDPNAKKAKDTVSTTIKIAIEDLKKQVPEAADDLDRLLAQITFSEPKFKFVPQKEWTQWAVERYV